MPSIAQTAQAFAEQRSARCHNAVATDNTYLLHGHPIAQWQPDGTLLLDWCGWYTRTTAAHMNAVLEACGFTFRVSYADARGRGVSTLQLRRP
jgi:hypothetical protein